MPDSEHYNSRYCQNCGVMPAWPMTIAWPDRDYVDTFVCEDEDCRRAVIDNCEAKHAAKEKRR